MPIRRNQLLVYLSVILAFAIPASIEAQSLDSEESSFLALINTYRAQNGAGPLQVSIALENSSSWMSNDMASKNYFSHTDSLGRDPFTRMAAFGYSYNTAEGENIAAGNSDAQDTFTQWQTACDPDSSGACTYAHRQNMLNPNYVVIGIGRAFGANSTYGWYWTTDFGGFLDATLGTGGSVAAPTINSFTASPSSITAGQATTLSWSVSGSGVTFTIDNGIGNVSNVTSVRVVPTQTTTYTLTAGNSGGSATARVVVTVNPVSTPQPPTTPAITSIVAKSPNEVDLSWTASSDSLGVAGYQIVRNGTQIASISGSSLSYADTTVSPGTSYSYNVRAFDSAGNFSNLSNTAQTTTPVATVVQGPMISAFTASPSSIVPGQTSNLTWNVSGSGVTLSIDNGVGNVSSVTSAAVQPAQTTTYTLTASNSAGSASAKVTVTVGSAGGTSGSQDLALNKAATQSSTLAPGTTDASKAVDGNTAGNLWGGTVASTNRDPNAWWQVDLGASATVSSIVVWNRTDCCGDRLSDYWVFVSDTPFGPNDTPQTLQGRAGTWSAFQPVQPNPSFTITVPGTQGRYVRIQLNNTGYLSLAEVQVFGVGGAPGGSGPPPGAPGQTSDLALNKTATQSSTFAPGTTDASKAVDGNTAGNLWGGTVASTNRDANAWWQVDLGVTATVSSIVVWNRTDCCEDRLTDYWIFVSNTPFGPNDTPQTLQSRAGTWSIYQATQPNPSATITVPGVQGRYVRVQLNDFNYLSLAEVQVIGQ